MRKTADDVVARRSGEVGRPAGLAIERHVPGRGPGERGPGRVVGVVGVGQDDRLTRAQRVTSASSQIAVFVPGMIVTSVSGSSSTP